MIDWLFAEWAQLDGWIDARLPASERPEPRKQSRA